MTRSVFCTTSGLALMLFFSLASAQQTCPEGYPRSTPSSDFADAGGGTVKHLPTGLIWKRCAEGQIWDDWNGGTCEGWPASYTWQQTFQRAEAVNAGAAGTWNAGQNDWRVPNLNELKSIVEFGCYSPAMNGVEFPFAFPADRASFWSSSPVAGTAGRAWVAFLSIGWEQPFERTNAYSVLFVRGGQYLDDFDGTSGTIPAWEFFNTNLIHYFVTAGLAEAQGIDTGLAGPGWARTGLSFRVYPQATSTGTPVCRFYGTPGRGPNSHFYTANAGECEWVKTDPGWTFEGLAFNTVVPSEGNCPSGFAPVYRAYNSRWAQNDSNHRFTTSATIYSQMIANGWTGEGVVMCSPSATGPSNSR